MTDYKTAKMPTKEIEREIETLESNIMDYDTKIDSLLKMRRLLKEVNTVTLGIMRNNDFLSQDVRSDMYYKYSEPDRILINHIDMIQDEKSDKDCLIKKYQEELSYRDKKASEEQ